MKMNGIRQPKKPEGELVVGKKRRFSELDLIRFLGKTFTRADAGLVRGIGDDCAVVRLPAGRDLLVTTDSLMEGVHFRSSDFKPEEVGQKAVAVAVSDVASMGGRPHYLFVSLFIPPEMEKRKVEALFRGIGESADRFCCLLAGGNISSSTGPLVIDVAVVGSVARGRTVYRHGARTGDGIYVTGTIGDSALGLRVLKSGDPKLIRKYSALVSRHKLPTPRLREGAGLGEFRIASSMIDVSDGLLLDLTRMLEAGSVGATIELDRVPVSPQARRYMEETGIKSLEPLISGGEDYELLFTVPKKNEKKLETLALSLRTSYRKIGEVTKDKGKLRILSRGKPIAVRKKGWVHLDSD